MKLRFVLPPLAAALAMAATPLMAQDKRTVLSLETAKKMAAACEAMAKLIQNHKFTRRAACHWLARRWRIDSDWRRKVAKCHGEKSAAFRGSILLTPDLASVLAD